MKIFDQWLLFAAASGFAGHAVRDYIGGHWWWALTETLLSVLTWIGLGTFRRALYGSPWPRLR